MSEALHIPLPFVIWEKDVVCWILLPPISAFANVSVCYWFSRWLRWIPSMANTPRTSAIFIKVEGGIRHLEVRLPAEREKVDRSRQNRKRKPWLKLVNIHVVITFLMSCW